MKYKIYSVAHGQETPDELSAGWYVSWGENGRAGAFSSRDMAEQHIDDIEDEYETKG